MRERKNEKVFSIKDDVLIFKDAIPDQYTLKVICQGENKIRNITYRSRYAFRFHHKKNVTFEGQRMLQLLSALIVC